MDQFQWGGHGDAGIVRTGALAFWSVCCPASSLPLTSPLTVLQHCPDYLQSSAWPAPVSRPLALSGGPGWRVNQLHVGPCACPPVRSDHARQWGGSAQQPAGPAGPMQSPKAALAGEDRTPLVVQRKRAPCRVRARGGSLQLLGFHVEGGTSLFPTSHVPGAALSHAACREEQPQSLLPGCPRSRGAIGQEDQ